MSQQIHYKERLNFGAPLEPVSRVLHGAGQDRPAWESYCELMCPAGLMPEMFMAYTGIRGLTRERLHGFDAYTEGPHAAPVMQLGLSMTRDGKPDECYAHEVAAGQHDAGIAALADYLKETERATLLRVGYECTGPWNGYKPESYKEAYRRVVCLLRDAGARFASVWCVEGGWTAPAWDYYPGDDFVDWLSVDLFAPSHFETTETFMQTTLGKGKPVLIGECTPRRVGVQNGEASWEAWFRPFLEWIGRHPHVKGFCYINWEWSGYPQWSDWGDARVQTNSFVAENWIREIRALTGGRRD